MLTFTGASALVRDERAAYRPYRATVASTQRMSPHFVLVTFTGPDLAWFGTDALDQRVKIVFPMAGVGLSDIGADDETAQLAGSWYELWRALPDERRNPFRTYTVRAVRPEVGEVDVLFVDHGPGGPAARWLASAGTGDEVLIVGPDVRSIDSGIGIDWHPGDARELLLAGDETAAPAICAILESLPSRVRARAFVEVPDMADALPVQATADVTITWLPRSEASIGALLTPAVREWVAANVDRVRPALAAAPVELDDVDVELELLWDSPAEASRDFYAWLAGESGVIKGLRRFLVTETGVDRGSVAFMGYWRLGRSEAQ